MRLLSPDRIVMMENHDDAYHAWKERGVRGRTLVHVDAHIDFGWVPEMDFDEIGSGGYDPSGPGGARPLLNPFLKPRAKMVHIGNYICPAMREGMVDRFYWVVPDASWRSRRGRRHIAKFLRQIAAVRRYADGRIDVRPDSIRCRVFGKEVIACGLAGLGRIDGPVLLDIDVDFLLTPRIWDDLHPLRRPWIFPDELFGALAAKTPDVDVLTIAYSVEGGFTPLRYKYLGDDLAAIFAGNCSGDRRAVMELKKRSCYREALCLDDADASLYYNLALTHLDGPEAAADKARALFQEAVSRDGAYRTVFNNYGILYLLRGDLARAERAYRQFLEIDRENAPALNGLGYIALKKRRYAVARGLFERCLGVRSDYPEARLGLGIALYKAGALAEAHAVFSALAAGRDGDAETYWWLGRIAERTGKRREAIGRYKDAVVRGFDGPAAHLRLARLYATEGNWFRVREELERFFGALKQQLA